MHGVIVMYEANVMELQGYSIPLSFLKARYVFWLYVFINYIAGIYVRSKVIT